MWYWIAAKTWVLAIRTVLLLAVGVRVEQPQQHGDAALPLLLLPKWFLSFVQGFGSINWCTLQIASRQSPEQAGIVVLYLQSCRSAQPCWLAADLPHLCICTPTQWVDRTIAMGSWLQFWIRLPFSLCKSVRQGCNNTNRMNCRSKSNRCSRDEMWLIQQKEVGFGLF